MRPTHARLRAGLWLAAGFLGFTLNQMTELGNKMNSVERVREFSQVRRGIPILSLHLHPNLEACVSGPNVHPWRFLPRSRAPILE
jgi:hypothetical protein